MSRFMLRHAAPLASRTLNPARVAWLFIAETCRRCVAGIIPSYLRSALNFLFPYAFRPCLHQQHPCAISGVGDRGGAALKLHRHAAYYIYDLI